MSLPLVVIVVVAQPVSPGSDVALEGMLEATTEGLPPGTRVQVEASAADTSRADVVVVLRWADDTRRRATLHVTTRDGRKNDRELAFGAEDPQRERGRALGYATVATIPEDLRAPELAPREVPLDKPATPPRAPAEPDVRVPTRADWLWIEATAQGTGGIVGSAGAVGGGLAVRFPLGPMAIRAGFAARAGEIAEADTTTLLLRGDVGLGFRTVVLDPRFAVGARTGFILFRHALRRTDAQNGPASGTHTLIGVEALAEASWALGPRFDLIAGAGTEVAFGTTRVLVGPDQVSVIPAFRLLAEVGARVRF